ncbi:MAG: hypothetical protein K2O15_15655 [Lachnospiraceae bacterium]|nr:hypothetical protein [Lachnospiraceae bacterium]
MEPTLCYIRENYFKDNPSFQKVLDTGDTAKQSRRTHLCLLIESSGNKFFIPLRNNLGAEIRKYGRIGHAIPSEKRKNAGLDYRNALIVNNNSYIELQTTKKIPESQYRRMKEDYEKIVNEFTKYLNGYIRALQKNRILKEPLYRESSLINFISELSL